MKPITPSEVARQKVADLPPEVIQAANECIASNFMGRCSQFTVNKFVDRLEKIMGIESDILVEKQKFRELAGKSGWLNIEEVYKSAGWKVEYFKPDYTESFDPYWIFTDGRRKS